MSGEPLSAAALLPTEALVLETSPGCWLPPRGLSFETQGDGYHRQLPIDLGRPNGVRSQVTARRGLLCMFFLELTFYHCKYLQTGDTGTLVKEVTENLNLGL